MKHSHISVTHRLCILTIWAAMQFFATAAWAQHLTQNITLQPGWNAVWLEVDPTNHSPAAVFDGVPVASVWTWSERVTATDFIQNPATAGWNKNHWLGWFPTNSPEALLANLYAILPARAYLVKLVGKVPISFQVTGTVVPQPTTWSPKQYNLRGFPADPGAPATFRKYFQYSPAIWDSSQDAPRGIYRLNPSGIWMPVSSGDTINRGEACWVYVNGASDYPAPESVEASTGSSVYFSPLAYRTTLTLANRTSEARTVVFSSAALRNKAYQVENVLESDPAHAFSYLYGYTVNLPPNGSVDLHLFLDRSRREPGASGVIFSLNDQMGTLQYIGFSSDGGGALLPGQQDDVGGSGGVSLNQIYPLAGLWIGTVQVNAVGEVHGTNLYAPTPVATSFPLRLLMHVDNNGYVRLLREVTMASLPNTSSNYLTTNVNVIVTNVLPVQGPSFLLSDLNLINQYQSRYRNVTGVSVRRLTSVQFDDATNPAGVPLTGSFVTNGILTGSLSIPPDWATNPYYHRYHPDHGAGKSFAVSRQVEFDFAPVGTGVPSYGVDGLDGTYRETVTGLHKVPLLASGTFTLQRVSTNGVLNPPLP